MIKGIGTDIVSKHRIKQSDVTERFLNNDEISILNKINDEEGKLDFISGRWAAKESIIKASNKEITFKEISILKSEGGAPIVFINGKERKEIMVSISHEVEYAVAFSIISKIV